MLNDLITDLLHHKALLPAHPDTNAVLARIMRLNISKFNETEVRCEILDPIIRLLGYDVENWASLKRERTVRVLGASKALDYSMLLFEEDFWVIEAKRPGKDDCFNRDDVYQALRYAAHPEINAALMLLCDGEKLEIYDREESLEKPLLRLARAEWSARFNEIRALLSPDQAWFFERRRVLRLVDKIFDQETHLERVEELRRAIDRKLISKRARVLDNWRGRVNFEGEFRDEAERLAKADAVELVETRFFVMQSSEHQHAMIGNVASQQFGHAQLIAYRIFPEMPRAANIAFWCHGLHYLLETHRQGTERLLLPSWLGDGSVTAAIETLIPKLLSGFQYDRDRHVVLLHALAFRRASKLMLLASVDDRRAGERLHAFNRFVVPELSFAQSVSSPSRHLHGTLDARQLIGSSLFVQRHTDENGRKFAGAVAEQELRELWAAELTMRATLTDYDALLKQSNLQDIVWSEAQQTSYDTLGHTALCVINEYPDWRDCTLQTWRSNVSELARNGSWQARRWLGLGLEPSLPPLDDDWAATRFFLGDKETAGAIYDAYAGPFGRSASANRTA